MYYDLKNSLKKKGFPHGISFWQTSWLQICTEDQKAAEEQAKERLKEATGSAPEGHRFLGKGEVVSPHPTCCTEKPWSKVDTLEAIWNMFFLNLMHLGSSKGCSGAMRKNPSEYRIVHIWAMETQILPALKIRLQRNFLFMCIYAYIRIYRNVMKYIYIYEDI